MKMQVRFGAVARVAAEAKDLATVYTIAGRDGDAAADEVSVQRNSPSACLTST